MVMVCDLCGIRIPERRRSELFVGIDGAMFMLALEDGTPIDTCVECHGAMRIEVLDRLACARERRAVERDGLIA